MSTNIKWFQTALHLPNSVLPKVLGRVIIVVIFAILIVYIHSNFLSLNLPILSSATPTVVIGLLLVFRTNTAYERFWEGRKLWGKINSNIRNLSRQIWLGSTQETELKKHILELLWVFAVSVKNKLRNQKIDQEVAITLDSKILSQLNQSQHLPLTVACLLQCQLQYYKTRTNLNDVAFGNLQLNLDSLISTVGGCERILKTPIPLAYSIHIKQLILLFCFCLPFQFVGILGYWSVIIVGLVSFAMMGIEEIAIEIENPFGDDGNDLPLDQICSTVRSNLDELMTFDNL